MSSRFIKNRLVDFGMIKPTEFLNLFFVMFILYVILVVCTYFFVLLQTIWIKIDSIRASMSECRKVNRLREGVACPLSLCLRLALMCSTWIIQCVCHGTTPASFWQVCLKIFYADNVVGFKLDSNQTSKFCL